MLEGSKWARGCHTHVAKLGGQRGGNQLALRQALYLQAMFALNFDAIGFQAL